MNRRPQVHGRVRQTVYDIDREGVPPLSPYCWTRESTPCEGSRARVSIGGYNSVDNLEFGNGAYGGINTPVNSREKQSKSVEQYHRGLRVGIK